MKISAVVLTKNEEGNIEKCLKSLDWADQIIIIDDYSVDKTVEIAKSRGAVIFKRKLNNDFSSQRNFGLKKAVGDWVLFVDADEIVSPSLVENIVRRVKKTACFGFYIRRIQVLGKKTLHCSDKSIRDWSLGPNKLIRLAKKGAGKWQGKVHEKWIIKNRVGNMPGDLYHHSFPNITTALKKINYYTSIQANDCFQKGKTTKVWQIITYPLGKFLKNFFWHQGFRDKTAGVVFCFLMSLHSFLFRGKLWQLNKTKEGK